MPPCTRVRPSERLALIRENPDGLSFRKHEFGKGNDNVETLSSKFIDSVRFLCLREQIVIEHKMDAGIHDWIGGKAYSI